MGSSCLGLMPQQAAIEPSQQSQVKQNKVLLQTNSPGPFELQEETGSGSLLLQIGYPP